MEASPAADEEVVQRDSAVRRLQQLPPMQRTVLVLRFYADQDDSSIAGWLGITASTVRSNQARGLATLRRLEHDDRHAEQAQDQ